MNRQKVSDKVTAARNASQGMKKFEGVMLGQNEDFCCLCVSVKFPFYELFL